jgi:hypothetical protein
VAADVEEGATAEAVPEAVQVVTDAVEGAKPPDEAGGNPLTGDRWGSRPELDSARRRVGPTVGANCRSDLETVAMGRLIEGARRW